MIFSTQDVSHAPLLAGSIYEGGATLADEPIKKLLPVANMSGIRPASRTQGGNALIALFSTGNEPDWPDHLNRSTGVLTYFGDNRTPNSELLSSPGNKVLDKAFRWSFRNATEREFFPPVFVFRAAVNHPPRSVVFEGLAVAGSSEHEDEWCVAKWFTKNGEKFQNYVVQLTLLADFEIKRSWIDDLISGNVISANCPSWYRHWVETGERVALTRS